MARTYTVSAAFISALERTALRLGYDLAPSAAVDNGSERLPLTNLLQLLSHLQAQQPDIPVGLQLGSEIDPACFDVLGHLVMACATVGSALQAVQQFQALVLDCARLECRLDAQTIWCDWQPLPHGTTEPRLLIDLMLAATRNFGVWATGIADPFLDVYFQYPAPADTGWCQRIFGQGGRYGCSSNGFCIPAEWGERVMRTGSHNLQDLIRQQAEQQLRQIRSGGGFITQLMSVLDRLLPQGQATVEAAAAALHLSPRTLQRQLSERNTRFSAVLREVRMQRARFLLQNSQLSVTDIALQVGYREHSSFSNAYKQWAGLSPHQDRLRQPA